MSALAGIYDEIYNLLIVDAPLMEWLRTIYAPTDPQYPLVRIWNGRAPKGYGPRLITIGESREDEEPAARTHEADGNAPMIRMHLFTEWDGAFLVGAQGIAHLARILNGAPMVLTDYTLIDGLVRGVTAMEDVPSQTYHTVAEYRAVVAAVG